MQVFFAIHEHNLIPGTITGNPSPGGVWAGEGGARVSPQCVIEKSVAGLFWAVISAGFNSSGPPDTISSESPHQALH